MVAAMKKVVNLGVGLTAEERNLLSVGYKNVVGSRRASWRILCSIGHKEEAKGNENRVRNIKEYRKKGETELSSICADIFGLIDEHLIPSAVSKQCSRSVTGRWIIIVTWQNSKLETIKKKRQNSLSRRMRACHLAKQAFDEAISELDTLSEESYKDSTLIMQLLRDNLTLWTSDIPEDGVQLAMSSFVATHPPKRTPSSFVEESSFLIPHSLRHTCRNENPRSSSRFRCKQNRRLHRPLLPWLPHDAHCRLRLGLWNGARVPVLHLSQPASSISR
ncbi:hypothetical protein ZIOFF_056064 [Zingiber officinale]|uniref:14-3-3 domain-containing protein n=1 Tax=Zingiber officinale TaxID=94328 RepID=A0A8J5FLJ2_ZINOF|nr:hypothetical protein ZIOFF_056064 [Zingiber officinale]